MQFEQTPSSTKQQHGVALDAIVVGESVLVSCKFESLFLFSNLCQEHLSAFCHLAVRCYGLATQSVWLILCVSHSLPERIAIHVSRTTSQLSVARTKFHTVAGVASLTQHSRHRVAFFFVCCFAKRHTENTRGTNVKSSCSGDVLGKS